MTSSRSSRPRLISLDVLRGAVMILMALDHARDFMGDIRLSPENLATTSGALFFTRWVTHFCAPVFVLLAGLSAFLYGSAAERTRAQLSRFLFTRGAWLLLLEFTLVNNAWRLEIPQTVWIFQVIAVLGVGMMLLAPLVGLPARWVGILGAACIAGHALLPPNGAANPADTSLWLTILNGGFRAWRFDNGNGLLTIYAVLPWFGVIALGYGLGPLFRAEARLRRRSLLAMGLGFSALFVLLRATNSYGDPIPFAAQDRSAGDLIAFLNTNKYPASLQYLLMTLGPSLVALALLEGARGAVANVLATFGRVPLLYYVAHVYLLHGAARLTYGLMYGDYASPTQLGSSPQGFPTWFGFGLPVVYLSWITTVMLLYLPCRAFARLKQRKRSWWLSYL
ncbi:MAG: hypothetical protein DHS20C15_12380 [Planctomycetota bacterium]|nr:MAG: hypothetical protein DHS20C15_12380 [Planctomycetota bacterium]